MWKRQPAELGKEVEVERQMECSNSYLLFLQEQIKDIITITLIQL